MKKGNTHINGKKFRNYLDNKMNDAERNRFERRLQKNPFEAEAVEGYESAPNVNFENDIAELKKRIRNTKRRSAASYWAAAATVLLLVTAGLLFYQLLYNEPPTSEMAAFEPEKQEVVIPPAPDSISEKAENRKEIAAAAGKNQNKKAVGDEINQETTANKKVPANPEITEATEPDSYNKNTAVKKGSEKLAGKPKAAAAARDTKSVAFSLRSQKAASPLQVTLNSLTAAAPDTIKMTKRTGFPIDSNDVFPDSFQTIPAEERERIQEVQGVAIQDQVELEGDPYLTDIEVHPDGGMEKYMNYIDKQAVLPPGYSSKKETVKLLLNIDKQGKIVQIQARNNADSLLVELSKSIIKNGPKWNPEVVNGEKIQSEVKLNIVFRKK